MSKIFLIGLDFSSLKIKATTLTQGKSQLSGHTLFLFGVSSGLPTTFTESCDGSLATALFLGQMMTNH